MVRLLYGYDWSLVLSILPHGIDPSTVYLNFYANGNVHAHPARYIRLVDHRLAAKGGRRERIHAVCRPEKDRDQGPGDAG
jgi:hypothetical protein